jgi:hypothetical protein
MSVEDIPRTVVHRGRELATAVARDTSVNTAGQADAAMGDMANLQALEDADLANVLGTAATRRLAQSLPSSSALPPAPRTIVIPLETFEVPAKRSLAAQLTDPADPGQDVSGPSGAKRARRGRAAAVTGELLAIVDKATALFGRLLTEYGANRANLAYQLLSKHRGLKQEAPPGVVERADRYMALVQQVRKAKADIREWTMSTANASMAAMVPVAEELESLSKALKEDLATFEQARDAVRTQRRQASAAEAKARARARADAFCRPVAQELWPAPP